MVIPMNATYRGLDTHRFSISQRTLIAVYTTCAAALVLIAILCAVRAATPNTPTVLRLSTDSVISANLSIQCAQLQRERGYLTVVGEVKNVSKTKLNNVEAVVELFNAKHDLLKVETALLEIPNVEPDDEAPFSVQTSEVPNVTAYRIRFRHLLGQTIPSK